MFDEQKTLPLSVIRIDGGTQCRLKIDTEMVANYAEHMADGAVFPPVVVHFDGKEYWLSDGFHRYHATKKINKTELSCNVIKGTVRDAILYSYGANGKHGLPMSNKDKRHIVTEMLSDFEWSDFSDREIARRCNVSHMLVSRIRAELKIANKRARTSAKELTSTKEEKPKQEPVATAEVEKLKEKVERLMEQVTVLADENDQLTDQLAKGSADDPEFIGKTLEELRQDNKQLRLEVRALTTSRDQFQAENAELKKQVQYLTKKLKKLDVAQVTDADRKAA